MKKFILLITLFFSISLCGNAQSAKSILDKTASTFTKSGIIKASFTVKNFTGQKQTGEATTGIILLNGKKFKLNAAGVTTWFDGKTQWTYVPANEEVNQTEPTDEELQAINPYNFLNLYKKGFNLKMGTTQKFSGKDIYDVEMVAKDSKMGIRQVVLFIDKKNYQLRQIKFRQGSNNWVSITVNSFAGNQKVAASTFTFNKKDAPNAEIIDLR